MEKLDPNKVRGPGSEHVTTQLTDHRLVKDRKRLADLSERILCALIAGRLESQTMIVDREYAHAAVALAAALILELGE